MNSQQYPGNVVIVPIQIRAGLTVRISGIPHDLTIAEAEKISRVVLALTEGRRAHPRDPTIRGGDGNG